MALIFITTSLMPLLSAMLMLKRTDNNTLQMHSKEIRSTPLFSNFLYYAMATYFIYTANLPEVLWRLMLAFSVSAFLLWLINFEMKISLHAAGAGALVALILALGLQFKVGVAFEFSLACLIAGLILSARLIAEAHSTFELYAGFFIGAIPVLLLLLLGSK
ncbi:MAG: hypothetical protein IPO27_17980 [Bacteroidetes bacterium]|nr:hypothetical protein [Bacteroidota bacterium]